MADQGALDRYADQIRGLITWQGEDGNGGINGHSIANLLWHGPAGLRQEVVDQIANDAVWGTEINGHSVADLLWHLRDSRPAGARLIRAPGEEDPTGAVYAVTVTSFKWITNGDILNAGTAAGLWGGWDSIVTVPLSDLKLLAGHLGGKLAGEPADPSIKAGIAKAVPAPPVTVEAGKAHAAAVAPVAGSAAE